MTGNFDYKYFDGKFETVHERINDIKEEQSTIKTDVEVIKSKQGTDWKTLFKYRETRIAMLIIVVAILTFAGFNVKDLLITKPLANIINAK